jgi:hypothetical protein
MSQIINIATELLAWGEETAFLYRTTNELIYNNLSGHLNLLSAYMYRLADEPDTGVLSFNTRVGDVVLLYADVIAALGFVPLSSIPTLDQVTTAGNVTLNNITVGTINASLANVPTSNVVYYDTSSGLLTYGQGTGLSPGLFAQTSDSTPITNTISELSLITTGVGSLSVPANAFKVGDSYVAYFSGIISSQNNATVEVHLRSNGIILGDTGLLVLAATTNKFWEMSINFVIRSIGGSGIASVITSGSFKYNKNSGNIPEGLGFSNLNNTTFNTTINNTLAVTAQWGNASTLNSIQTRIFNLYKIY